MTPIPAFQPPLIPLRPVLVPPPAEVQQEKRARDPQAYKNHLYDLMPFLTAFQNMALNMASDTCRFHGTGNHKVAHLESGPKHLCVRCMADALEEYLDDDGF